MKRVTLFTMIMLCAILASAQKYQISAKGKAFIKSYEKCVLNAYNDPDPKRRSIGWGHQLRPHERHITKITKKQADKFFDEDIEWVNASVNRILANAKFKPTQGFVDGLASLVYNCGEAGVKQSTFYQRLLKCRPGNQNDLNFTIAAVKTCRVSSPGHVKRRYDEHRMMLD